MLRFFNICLGVIFAFSSVGHTQMTAELKNSLLETLSRIQDGIAPPPEDKTELKRVGEKLHQNFSGILQLLKSNSRDQPPSCKRFVSISNRLVELLDHEAAEISDLDFMRGNRFQIATFAFAELNSLLSSGAEGGYSILNRNSQTACDLPSHEAFVAQFDETTKTLAAFFNLAFGNLGLKQMNETQLRLIHLAIEDEKRDNRNFWIIAGAGTLASIAIWELAPVVATTTVRMIGIKSSAFVAEGLALNYAGELASTKVELPKVIVGSWNEHMSTIELFLDAPLRSPDLQLALLSGLHSQLLNDVMPLIEVRALLSEDAKSIRPTLDRLEMLRLLRGTNVAEQLPIVARFVEKNYGLQVECGTSWGFALSPPRCLLGIRTLAEALASQSKISPDVKLVSIADFDRFIFSERARVNK